MKAFKRFAALPLAAGIAAALVASAALAQERLPWKSPAGNATVDQYAQQGTNDAYRGGNDPYSNTPPSEDRFNDDRYDSDRDVYVPPPEDNYQSDESFRADDRARPPASDYGYGEPYQPPPRSGEPYRRDYGDGPPPNPDYADRKSYNQSEIIQAGHSFFGSISKGLASAVEYVFRKQGRPNGYILGEDAGGAFIVGLRYGEGTLYTKDAGDHKVYWQGPSLGYDAGAEGSKTMVLVYNLSDVSDVYHRFAGVQGSLYVIGGVGVQFQKYGNVTLAVIRSGVGLRMGANVGYLKYTRSPTWNPL